MYFPSHVKLEPKKPSLVHRSLLRGGAHKSKPLLQEADNKAGAGKQRPPQPSKALITESPALLLVEGQANAA